MAIDKRSKGVYRFRVQFQKHSYTTTFYGTEKQAKLEHEKFKIAVKSGQIKEESSITLRELWNLYLKNKDLKANSILVHQSAIKKFDYFLDTPVTEITPLFIEEMKMKKAPFSYYSSLRAVLNYAVFLEIIEKTPFSKFIEKNKVAKYEELLTKEQLASLIDALFESKEKKIATLLLMQLLCGLRVGEARGLKVSDFDLNNLDVLKIQRQYGIAKVDASGMVSLGETTPKTESSVRTVFVPKMLHERLTELIDFATCEYLFSINGRTPVCYKTISLFLSEICEENDLPYLSTHKLRSLFTTLSIYSGIDVMSISKTLGHTSVDMTERYLRAIESETKKSYEKINETVLKLKKSS